MNEFKAIPFEVGDIVIARMDAGLPASPRNFHPLKDRGEEFAEYKKLEDEYVNSKGKDKKAGEFSITMVFPPHELGRYKIIQGEQYKILVAGKYVFFNAKSKEKSQST